MRMPPQILALAVVLLAAPAARADNCHDRRMSCYLDAASVCASFGDDRQACMDRIMASCDRQCGDAPAEPRLNPGHRLRVNVEYASNCRPYRRMLEQKFRSAAARLQNCLNYGFVREDIADRMVTVINQDPPMRVRCEEPPRSNWCAAAGMGDIWFSPSKTLRPGSFCHDRIESFFVHEAAHIANLEVAPGHNENGETGQPDEVYSLTSYCMFPARMWIQRARRTRDVVQPSKLSCMRRYQEMTPSTLRDPFWGEYSAGMNRGESPCL